MTVLVCASLSQWILESEVCYIILANNHPIFELVYQSDALLCLDIVNCKGFSYEQNSTLEAYLGSERSAKWAQKNKHRICVRFKFVQDKQISQDMSR